MIFSFHLWHYMVYLHKVINVSAIYNDYTIIPWGWVLLVVLYKISSKGVKVWEMQRTQYLAYQSWTSEEHQFTEVKFCNPSLGADWLQQSATSKGRGHWPTGSFCFVAFCHCSVTVLSDSANPRTAAHQAPCPPLSPSLLKFMSIVLVMPSNHLIFCCLFPLPQPFPASGTFPVSGLFTSGGQSIGALAFKVFKDEF